MSNTTDYAAAFAEVNENVSRFNELAQTMCELYEKKNADYGDSFNISLDKYGIIAALTRISDKFNRIENLILNQNKKVEDEKVEDTLIDLANYAMMTVLWIKRIIKLRMHYWINLAQNIRLKMAQNMIVVTLNNLWIY